MPSRSRQMPVEALASAALARMTDGQKRKNERKCRRRNADRRKALLPWLTATAAPLSGEAHIYRRSTAVLVPRSLSSARDSAPGQASCDAAGTRFAHPFERHYPPLPVPVQRRTSRSGRNAGEMMPNAARERVASPPAGAALARAGLGMPPRPRPTERGSEYM